MAASGFLSNEYVLYYHPLDDFIEFTENLAWSSTGGDDADILSTLLTSGIRTAAGDSVYQMVYPPGTPYDTLFNASGTTCAMWVSGFLGGDSDDRQISIGIANNSNSFRDGFTLTKTTSSSGFRIDGTFFTILKTKNWIPPPSNDSGWHFFILDLRYETSGWRHRVSLDGNEWINLGVNDHTGVFSANPRPSIKIFDHVTGPKIVLDEVILWGDNDLFTNDELSNLYELFNTYNTTMDQYINTFGTPANSGIDLFIHGYEQTSGNIFLYIPGQYEIKSIDLFIEGFIQISGNVGLYISGTPPIASSSIDLYIIAPTPINDNINLYTVGPLSTSGNADNFIQGHQISSDNIDQYIQGYQTTSGNIDLYISGIPAISSSINLYIVGPLQISGNINDFIIGHLPISGNFSLFIQNSLEINAFVSVVDNNPSNNFSLSIHGVPSGESTTFYINNTITFFIDGTGGNVELDRPAFAKVVDATSIPYSDIWQSFVKGGNTANDNIDLYINSHASGDTPHGILIINSFTTFINGQATQDGDEGLLSNGYFAINLETSSFAKVHLGLNDTFNLYVSGEIPIIPPSATLNLFTFGILDVTSGSYTLYIPSKESINDNYNLFIFGIQGIESGNLPLYLEVTNIGLFNQEINLYSHGF